MTTLSKPLGHCCVVDLIPPIRIDADNEATVALGYGSTAYPCNLEFGRVFFSVVDGRLKGARTACEWIMGAGSTLADTLFRCTWLT